MTLAKKTVAPHWDAIDPTMLMPLAGFRRTTDEFGFLLRHYWMPETVLTYESTTEQQSLLSDLSVHSVRISRRMLKCDADICTWRERKETHKRQTNPVRFSPDFENRICTYDRFNQTFTVRTNSHEACLDGRTQAFLNQPVLNLLLPVPLEFCWHVTSKDDDYMEFMLESQTIVGDMPVLFIRRKGRFSLDAYFYNDDLYEERFEIKREGVTAYAPHRSIVLEDRTRDTIVKTEQNSRLTGLEMKNTLKLVESVIPNTNF